MPPQAPSKFSLLARINSLLLHGSRTLLCLKNLYFKAHVPITNKSERDALGATFVHDSNEKAKMLVQEETGSKKTGNGWANVRL